MLANSKRNQIEGLLSFVFLMKVVEPPAVDDDGETIFTSADARSWAIKSMNYEKVLN